MVNLEMGIYPRTDGMAITYNNGAKAVFPTCILNFKVVELIQN